MNLYEDVLQNHALFLLMLILHQIVLYILKRIFQKEYKSMMIDNKIRDEKLQHDINREAAIEKLINMNTLQMKKYYLLIKDK